MRQRWVLTSRKPATLADGQGHRLAARCGRYNQTDDRRVDPKPFWRGCRCRRFGLGQRVRDQLRVGDADPARLRARGLRNGDAATRPVLGDDRRHRDASATHWAAWSTTGWAAARNGCSSRRLQADGSATDCPAPAACAPPSRNGISVPCAGWSASARSAASWPGCRGSATRCARWPAGCGCPSGAACSGWRSASACAIVTLTAGLVWMF